MTDCSGSANESITTSLHDYHVPMDMEVRQLLAEQYGESVIEKMVKSLKIPPGNSFLRVNWLKASSREEVIEHIRSQLTDNWKLSKDVEIGVKAYDAFPDTIQIHVTASRTGLLHSSVPPSSGPELFSNWPSRRARGWPMTHHVVVCDRFCAEAVLRGSHIFVKGILSADAGISAHETVAVYGYVGPDKKKPTRGSHLLVDVGPCIFLGLGDTHCARSEFFSNETGIGVSMSLARAAPAILPPLHDASHHYYLCMMQNLPSLLVSHALDPQPGDTILDMCCAPGGKTTHVASLVRGNATIVACDKSLSKVLRVRDLIQDMGASHCITPLVLDATKIVLEGETRSVNEKENGLLDITGFPPASFDRILLDPPCSALGLRPKLVIPMKAKELKKTAVYQRLFLEQAIRLLKPGGTMTYSTCTINALENEQNVAFVLQEFGSCINLLSLAKGPGQTGLEGQGLSLEQRQSVRRFDPSDARDDCMGFFVAKFQKKSA